MANKKFLIALGFFVFYTLNSISLSAPETIKDKGFKIYKSGNYQKAIEFHLKYLNTYPDDEMMLLYLAYSYINVNKLDEAEMTYLKILKLNNENELAKSGLSTLYKYRIGYYVSNKKYNTAFDYIKKGEYYLPKRSLFYAEDAKLNYKIENFFAAKKMWEKSWSVDKEVSGRNINMWKLKKAGECSMKLGDTYLKEWRDFVYSIYKKAKDERDVLILMADAYFFRNEQPSKRYRLRTKALKLYEKAVGARYTPKVAFPLKGRYQITSGYNQVNFDTHNGYDAYCIDLVALTEDGKKLRKGAGLENSDYLSHGKEIYAVADGTVVSMIDIFADNKIGEQNYFTPNLIKIKHNIDGAIFYSMYVHILKDSSKVNIGDTVTKGQLIAQIGNSGYSFAPHLHFGVYDTNNISIPVEYEGISVLKKGVIVESDIIDFKKKMVVIEQEVKEIAQIEN